VAPRWRRFRSNRAWWFDEDRRLCAWVIQQAWLCVWFIEWVNGERQWVRDSTIDKKEKKKQFS
jgi:hypothetical protein